VTIRIEVQADMSIEVMRPRPGARAAFLNIRDLKKAMRQVRFFLKEDLAQARDECFVPALDKTAWKETKKLFKGDDDDGATKTATIAGSGGKHPGA